MITKTRVELHIRRRGGLSNRRYDSFQAMQLATQFIGGRLSLLNHNNAGGSAGSAMTRVVSVSRFQIRRAHNGCVAYRPRRFLLCLVMLVLASVAVSLFSVRLKAALHILAGMAVGLASGVATGALFGGRELVGKLAWQLMCCGGIWRNIAIELVTKRSQDRGRDTRIGRRRVAGSNRSSLRGK